MSNQVLVASCGYGNGILTHARAWLADSTSQGKSVCQGHEDLIIMLGELFTKQGNGDVEKAVEQLHYDGFEIGYDKSEDIVSITHSQNGHRLAVRNWKLLADYKGDQTAIPSFGTSIRSLPHHSN